MMLIGLNSPYLHLVAVGWIVMALIMAALYLLAYAYRNAGVVDAGWAAGVAILAVLYAALADGFPPRQLFLAIMAGLWGVRLSGYLIGRLVSTPEDGRYQSLRRQWGGAAETKFFLFFQLQALWAVMFSLPFLVTAFSQRPGPDFWDYLGIGIWLAAVIGEAQADEQLASFKALPENRGRTCDVGLWRYSRHPNYFFEWLHWFAYISMAVGAKHWLLTWSGPAVMGLFLWRVTGIPYTEKQAMKSRGESYREYQRRTSAFFPWFPKKP